MIRLHHWIILIVLLMLLPTANVIAQDDTEAQPPLVALQWGADYFPYPEWIVNLTTSVSSINASWVSSGEFPAIVSYRRQFVDQQYTVEATSEIVNEEWLNEVMVGYDSWEESQRCFVEDVIVVEINAVFEESPYVSRYWVRSDGQDFISIFAAYFSDNESALLDMGKEFFGAAVSCPAESQG